MLGFFGAQTGAPCSLVTVVDTAHAPAVRNKDLVVIGSPEDQPLLSDWALQLPVQVDQGEFQANEQSSPLSWLQVPYWLQTVPNNHALQELLSSEVQSDAVIQGAESPLDHSRTLVLLALRDRNSDSFGSLFLPASDAGSIYGTVSVSQNGRFHSFDLGETYRMGDLDWRDAFHVWLHSYLWAMPLLIVLAATLWAAWLYSWVEKKARARLQLRTQRC
jgi:hypothetical protein